MINNIFVAKIKRNLILGSSYQLTRTEDKHCSDLTFILGEYDDDVDDDHEYIDDKDDYHDYNGDDDDAGAKTRYDICGIPPALISPQFG